MLCVFLYLYLEKEWIMSQAADVSPVIASYRDEATWVTLEAYKGHLRGILAFFKTLRFFSKYK